MLFLYLQQLQSQKQDEKILDSVSELKSISKRMNEMIFAVGKNVIKEDSFEDVLHNQNKIVIEFFVEQFCDNINFNENDDISLDVIKKAFEILKTTVLNPEKIKAICFNENWDEILDDMVELNKQFQKELLSLDYRLQIESFNYYKICQNYAKKIIPIIESNTHSLDYLNEKLFEEFKLKITGLPF